MNLAGKNKRFSLLLSILVSMVASTAAIAASTSIRPEQDKQPEVQEIRQAEVSEPGLEQVALTTASGRAPGAVSAMTNSLQPDERFNEAVALPSADGPSIARPLAANSRRPTIALALGGGGVRAAAHIAVLRVLEKEHIPVDYIVGSSMGAVLGGMYAAGVSLDTMEKMFRDRSLFKALTPVPVIWKLTALPIRLLVESGKHAIGIKADLISLYSENKLDEFVSSHLPPDRQNIEQCKIPFAAVAINLLDGKTCLLERGSLGRAVQASSAIPFYVKPVVLDGKLLVDGALRANVPTLQARQTKADIVISVNVNENLQTIDKRALTSLTGLSNRLITVMLGEMAEHQEDASDVVIRPAIVDISLYSRSADDALQAMRAGEEAAIMAIPQIRALVDGQLAAVGPNVSAMQTRSEASPDIREWRTELLTARTRYRNQQRDMKGTSVGEREVRHAPCPVNVSTVLDGLERSAVSPIIGYTWVVQKTSSSRNK